MLDNTASELIQRVRDITDEDNTTDIGDDLVLRMLNRAQQELARILTRRYKNHFMREVIYTGSDMTTDANGQSRVLKLNSQAYGYAVNSIDVSVGGQSWFPVSQSPANFTLGSDSVSTSALPDQYFIQGNDAYFYPTPNSDTQVRVRYQFRPHQLVASQGRITSFTDNDGSADTLVVDSLGSSLSTSVDNLSAFVNIVDHLTGEVKATLQVTGLNTTSKTLTFSTAPSRSAVFGYTVSSSLPTTIALDDYVTLAHGSCVPLFSYDLTNFLVELAGFYTKQKLGTIENADFENRNYIIKAIEGMQFGRQHTKKIKHGMGTGPYSMQWFFQGI